MEFEIEKTRIEIYCKLARDVAELVPGSRFADAVHRAWAASQVEGRRVGVDAA